MRAVLTEAIAKGGSTLRDYVDAVGEPGYFQLDYFVYGREGEPCRVCGTPDPAAPAGRPRLVLLSASASADGLGQGRRAGHPARIRIGHLNRASGRMASPSARRRTGRCGRYRRNSPNSA